MTTQDTIRQFERYVIQNYTRTPIVFVRGEGSRLWDADGRCYLDLFPGWGVNGLGHCHPRVVAAIREQAGKLLHVANNYYMEPQGRLAQIISEKSFGGQCFFCNSGAEAVESAIKLARLHTPEGKYKIITMENSFHGRTLAAITATAQAKYQKGLDPLPAGFTYVPFNDVPAVEVAIDDATCGVMVEPIQGEGGINVPDADYLAALRALCDSRGLLLILDEVQTGAGRTGKWFGHQHFGVEPDIMAMAKALGGGVAIGAIAARPEVAKSLVPGTHASTFGGNPIACAAAIAAFEAIEEEGLLEHAARIGKYARGRFEALRERFSFIKDVRGLGVMIGIELDRPGADVVNRCLERGLLINCTHDTVIRLLPAMIVTQEEMDQGIAILEEAFSMES